MEALQFKRLLLLLFLSFIVLSVHGSPSNEKPGDNAKKTDDESSDSSGAIEEVKYAVYEYGFAVYQDGAANRTLFISGVGFTADTKMDFEPPLGIGKRVSMTLMKDPQGKPIFGLRLLKSKTWLKENAALPFVPIYVTKMWDAKTDKVLFMPEEPVLVAKVFPRPQLSLDYRPEIIKSTEADFTVTGNSLSPKDTVLVFNPPLEAARDYDYMINPEGTEITLSLRRGARWRKQTGDLEVVAIRGGAGRINLPKPVVVAKVTAAKADSPDSDYETLSAIENPVDIYASSSEINLKGTGFRSDRLPQISFKGDGVAVQNADFDVVVNTDKDITLVLHKSSSWLSVAGTLVVEYLNGELVNPPLEVANVHDKPIVERDRRLTVYESQTVTIVIKGEGFYEYLTSVALSPPLKQDVDFTITVRDHNTMELDLVQGKKWPRGQLSIIWVEIGRAGKVYQNQDQPEKGLRIALVEADFQGAVSIQASSQRIYQSETETITVQVLALPPKVKVQDGDNVPVQLEFSSNSDARVVSGDKYAAFLTKAEKYAATLTMTLQSPLTDSWLDGDGQLFLVSIKINGKQYSLGTGTQDKRGVQIARVLPDIRVHYVNPPLIVYMSYTSSILVTGSGFTFSMSNPFDDFGDESADDDAVDLDAMDEYDEVSKSNPPVVLDPPLLQDEDFMVIFDNSNQLTFQLFTGKKWRSSAGELKLVSLDSGGGPIHVNIVIAKVAEDDPNLLCSNDCPYETPNDGDCGDTKPNPQTGDFSCWGKDCADCGPRKPDEGPTFDQNDLCSDSCGEQFANDGICQDGRPGTWSAACSLCTDCSDCGPCPEEGFANLPFCTNGLEGSANELVPGLPCIFPFTYDGIVYDGSQCVKDGRVTGGWGWCPTTENFQRDGKWGSCQYCQDVSDMDLEEDFSYDEDEGEMLPKKSVSKKSKAKGFDFGKWLVQTLFFLVVFFAIGSVIFLVWKRNGAQFRYEAVNSKAA